MQKSILKEKEYKKPARTADNDVLKKIRKMSKNSQPVHEKTLQKRSNKVKE